ncbi:50S ribosomal protein L4 [Iris pallida]|uniref:Large ribosomal subunit protein uL4c n=1 Tax=Iris pallida TaxID=29817 RepID=A0AAX6I900_IRIPA|nr:50S ribosomal protein L4 [Iris pallida]
MSMLIFSTTASSLSFFSSSLFLPPNSLSPHLKSPTPPPILHLHCSRSRSRSLKAQLSPSGGGNGSATLPVLSFTGEKVDSATLSLKSAPSSTARAVVHRGIIADQQNSRRGTASTLTRAEVRGGGKKPYPQKKTGRARRGSQRTPLRPGGGVTFGPKPRDWSIKINRKEKRLAVSTAIASAKDERVRGGHEEVGPGRRRRRRRSFFQVMKKLREVIVHRTCGLEPPVVLM